MLGQLGCIAGGKEMYRPGIKFDNRQLRGIRIELH